MHADEAAQVTHTYSCQGASPRVGHPDLCVTDFRLDGSAEPSNEILEQGSHDRPLVAQTYSAAVTKGMFIAGFIYFFFYFIVNYFPCLPSDLVS